MAFAVLLVEWTLLGEIADTVSQRWASGSRGNRDVNFGWVCQMLFQSLGDGGNRGAQWCPSCRGNAAEKQLKQNAVDPVHAEGAEVFIICGIRVTAVRVGEMFVMLQGAQDLVNEVVPAQKLATP